MTDRPGDSGSWPISPNFCPGKKLPTLDDLVRLDQITRFPHLTKEDRDMYYNRATYLWAVIHNTDENSTHYRNAFMELLGLSLLLKDGLEIHQDTESIDRGPSDSQTSCPPTTQQKPDEMTMLKQRLSSLSPGIKLKVDAFSLYLPPGKKECDMQCWILKVRVGYADAVARRENGQMIIDTLANARSLRQNSELSLNEEELVEYNSKMKEAEKMWQKGVLGSVNIRLLSEKRKKEGGKLCSRHKWL